MKIDLTKVDTVIIFDSDGNVCDRFQLASMALIKDKITGNRLEMYRPKENKPKPVDGGAEQK